MLPHVHPRPDPPTRLVDPGRGDLVTWQLSLGMTRPPAGGHRHPQADLDNPETLITPLREQAFFQHWLQRDAARIAAWRWCRYRLMHFGHLGLIVPHAATRRDAIALFTASSI